MHASEPTLLRGKASRCTLLPRSRRRGRTAEGPCALLTAAQPRGRQADPAGQQAKQQPPPHAPATPAVEIPAMGWMWQVGKSPSAAATVADLKQDRIKPKKSLGQNFLTDDAILQDIVRAAGVKPGELVLEIGPGTGNLTKHLLESGARVTAVEKDDVLYARLAEQYKQEPNLRIVRGDALRADVGAIIRDMLLQERGQGQQQQQGEEGAQDSAAPSTSASAGAGASIAAAAQRSGKGRRPGASKVRVVANLPYNITTDFLKIMLPMGELVSELSVMIQEEVAQRLVSRKAARKDYRAMSLRVLFYSNPKYRFLIPKEKYYPAPGVDGALVTFQLLPPDARLTVPSERGFIRFVGKAFLERRKMMKNSVAPLYTEQQVEAALLACGLRPSARAQDLTLEQFVAVYCALSAAEVQGLGLDAEIAGEDEDGESLLGEEELDD